MADADELAREVVAALARGDGRTALRLVEPALAAAEGRPRLVARLYAWTAQARLFVGDAKGAWAAVTRAVRAARQAGDAGAIPSLRALQAQAAIALQAAQAPPNPPDTPLSRALAAFDAGDLERGEALARAALAAATNPRDEVLALLALGRVPREAWASIRRAAQVADASGDMNLVAAVARAARAAGVDLGTYVF